jgi:hypothetical protein
MMLLVVVLEQIDSLEIELAFVVLLVEQQLVVDILDV